MRTCLLLLCFGASCVSEPTTIDDPTPPPIDPTPYDQLPKMYGNTIAVGDFDGDGIDDMAVGSPNAPAGGQENAGGVQIWRGTAGGFVWSQTLTAADAGTTVAADANFGFALAARDMDRDGSADLVVGCPSCVDQDGKAGGAVFVYKGGSQLVSTKQVLSQSMFSSEVAETYDDFGESVAIAFLAGSDEPATLVVGAPGETYQGEITGWVNTFTVGSNLLAGTSQGFNFSGFDSDQVTGTFGAQLAVLDVNGDGVDDLVVESQESNEGVGTLYTYTGSPLHHLQRITSASFVGSLAVGNFFGKTWPNGKPMPQLATIVRNESNKTMSYVGILEPNPSGSALGLIDLFDDPQSATNWGDGFGAAMAVADFDHDGDDELVVGAPGTNVGAPGHVYVYRSAAGTGMKLWGSRAMPAATCETPTTCWFGRAVGVGYFHTKTPPLGDFDMVVGAPYANSVFYYQADGNGTIPSYIESYGPH